jgi:hypothetical protein
MFTSRGDNEWKHRRRNGLSAPGRVVLAMTRTRTSPARVTKIITRGVSDSESTQRSCISFLLPVTLLEHFAYSTIAFSFYSFPRILRSVTLTVLFTLRSVPRPYSLPTGWMLIQPFVPEAESWFRFLWVRSKGANRFLYFLQHRSSSVL